MRAKLRHECERCGLIAEFERAGRFTDDDFYEVFHERMDLEARLRERARSLHETAKRLFWEESEACFWENQAALYRAQLIDANVQPMDCDIVQDLPPNVETEETEGCPF